MQGGSAEITVNTGDTLTLSTDCKYADCGDNNTIYVDYPNITKVHCYNSHTTVVLILSLHQVLSVDSIVYVDDGLISLRVKEKGENFIKTEVVNGGKIGSRKGVNLPNIEVDLPAVSEKDIK